MNKERGESGLRYREIGFFLVLVPCINALNYYLTYTHIGFNWHTLLTFSIDTLQGYAAWLAARGVILWLDRKMPYPPNPLKRIFVQLLLSSAAALLVIVISTEFLNWIVKGEPMPASFYRFDIFIFLIWFFVINGIYVGLYYYQRLKETEQMRQEEKKLRQGGFSVKSGKQNLYIGFIEAAGIYVEGDYAVLVTTQGRKHLLDLSLDKVEKLLPAELFFRLNRQYILHRNMIKGYEKLENGKINILPMGSPHFPGSIPMSRTKAPAFKSWFQPAE